LAEEVSKEAEYFATNASRMRYPEFRKKGFFVGSGVLKPLQVRHRIAPEAIRHVLDCPRC